MDAFSDALQRLALNVTSFANRLREVLDSPSSVMRPVTVTILAGATTGTAEHGLGHGYQYGVIAGQSAAGDVYVLSPDGTTSATLLTVGITAAPVADITVSVLVS